MKHKKKRSRRDKRRARRHQQTQHKCGKTNRHHLWFVNRRYTTPAQRKLRTMFVFDIDINLHRRLHECCSPVPPPDDETCLRIINAFKGKKPMSYTSTVRAICLLVDDQDIVVALKQQLQFLR